MNEMLPVARIASTSARPRYTAVAQGLHWLTVILVFTTLPIAWIMQSMSRGPHRETYVGIHKSLGVTILLLVVARLLWRAWCRAPPLPQSLSPFMSMLAKSTHWALYALFLAVPVSGYILSAAGGHTVPFFGLFQLPALPHDEALAHAAAFVHNTLRWLVYALILGHVGATVWHVAWRRDGTLERMLPAQTGR